MGLNIGSNYSILKSGALNEWHRMNLMICFCFDVLCCPFHRKCCPWYSVAAEGCFVLERRKQRARARARADEVSEWQLVDSTLLRSMTELTHLLTSRHVTSVCAITDCETSRGDWSRPTPQSTKVTIDRELSSLDRHATPKKSTSLTTNV